MEFLSICFAAGLLLAIPIWIVWQRAGSHRGLAAIRHFDPRDAVPCDLEPVALRARLLPETERIERAERTERATGGTP